MFTKYDIRASIYYLHNLLMLNILFYFVYSDVDECTINNGSSCDSNSICVNTAGSYNCYCKPGYYWNGTHCTGKIQAYNNNFIEFML